MTCRSPLCGRPAMEEILAAVFSEMTATRREPPVISETTGRAAGRRNAEIKSFADIEELRVRDREQGSGGVLIEEDEVQHDGVGGCQ